MKNISVNTWKKKHCCQSWQSWIGLFTWEGTWVVQRTGTQPVCKLSWVAVQGDFWVLYKLQTSVWELKWLWKSRKQNINQQSISWTSKGSQAFWLERTTINFGNCSMKRTRSIATPLDGILVHRRLVSRVAPTVRRYLVLYSWVEREALRVKKYVAQEHNTMSSARHEPNQYVTVSPFSSWKRQSLHMTVIYLLLTSIASWYSLSYIHIFRSTT